MTIELKVGDVVRLRTGGPNMTVSEIYERGGVETVWFEQVAMKDGTIAWGAMHSADWVPEILEKVS
jgi:uncharacterized protein YodC (DUF2158 family)